MWTFEKSCRIREVPKNEKETCEDPTTNILKNKETTEYWTPLFMPMIICAVLSAKLKNSIDNQGNIWNRMSRIVKDLMLYCAKNGGIVLGEEKIEREVISLFCNYPIWRINFELELISRRYRDIIRRLFYVILKGYSGKRITQY